MVKFDLYSKEYIFRGSSMVEQETVNFKVLGSSPSRGANYYSLKLCLESLVGFELLIYL
jgi:hypothetical protein